MGRVNWNIDELLSVGESIILKVDIENEDNNSKIKVFLTNYRIIWIDGNFVDCRLLKFICKYGVFSGYEEYSENADIGTGEYGVYFGSLDSYETLWFYSEDIWKEFYEELSRAVLELD